MARCFKADGQAPTEFWGILYAEFEGFCGTDLKNVKVLYKGGILVAESAIKLLVTAFWNTWL